MSTVLPTHTCFDDAMDYLELRVRMDPDEVKLERLWLIHAICIVPDGPDKGQRFAHAWVEVVHDDGRVDAVQDGFIKHAKPGVLGMKDGTRITYSVDAAELRKELQVERDWRYSLRDVWAENNASMTYGPWVPELQELCRKKSRTQPSENSP